MKNVEIISACVITGVGAGKVYLELDLPNATPYYAARALRSPHAHRAKVMRNCPKCNQLFGAREMRKHVPKCPGPWYVPNETDGICFKSAPGIDWKFD